MGVFLFHVSIFKIFCSTLHAGTDTLLTESEALAKRGEVFSVLIS